MTVAPGTAAEKPEFSARSSDPEVEKGACMKSTASVAVLGGIALLLAGCGNTMRGYLERDTPTETAAVRQDLTMPPDLRLPPPGSAPAAPEPAPASSYDNGLAAPAPATPVSPVTQGGTVQQDKYAKAGISRTKPDGTAKTDYELDQELRQVYLARKRAQNPNYGTVMNIGNIFKDE